MLCGRHSATHFLCLHSKCAPHIPTLQIRQSSALRWLAWGKGRTGFKPRQSGYRSWGDPVAVHSNIHTEDGQLWISNDSEEGMPILAKYIMIFFLLSEVTDDVSGKPVGILSYCWMRNFLARESCILPAWRGRRASEDKSRQCYVRMGY